MLKVCQTHKAISNKIDVILQKGVQNEWSKIKLFMTQTLLGYKIGTSSFFCIVIDCNHAKIYYDKTTNLVHLSF